MKHLRAAFPKESAKTFPNLSFDFGKLPYSLSAPALLHYLNFLQLSYNLHYLNILQLSYNLHYLNILQLSRNFMAFNLYDSDISVTLALVKSTSIIVPKYCC